MKSIRVPFLVVFLTACWLLAGCTGLHPIRPDPDGQNFKGAGRTNLNCDESNNSCVDNKVYASPRNATQALHNVMVYRDFYNHIGTERRISAARWSDTFAVSTLVGVLGMAIDSARAVRVGILGAAGAETMEVRYQFAKQADEFLLAAKVLRCIEDHAKDALPADGATVSVSGGPILVQRTLAVAPSGGGNPVLQELVVQEKAAPEVVRIDVRRILRDIVTRVNERLSERLKALTPAKLSAEDLRQSLVRQKEAFAKGERSTASGGRASTDPAALKAAVALEESVDACYAEMK